MSTISAAAASPTPPPPPTSPPDTVPPTFANLGHRAHQVPTSSQAAKTRLGPGTRAPAPLAAVASDGRTCVCPRMQCNECRSAQGRCVCPRMQCNKSCGALAECVSAHAI
jgi:hypothetical protein